MYQHLISPYFIEKEEVIDLTLAEAHLSFRKITYDAVQQGKVMVQHYTVEFLRKVSFFSFFFFCLFFKSKFELC